MEEVRVGLCLGLDGGRPLKKGFVLWGDQNQDKYNGRSFMTMYVVDSADKANARSLVGGIGLYTWVGEEKWWGRLTLADVAVGKAVYYLEPERDAPGLRVGRGPEWSRVTMPGVPTYKGTQVFPESACAGLR